MEQLERGVWHITREYSGIAEAGGVKDVVAGLAQNLAQINVPSTVVIPCYGFIDLNVLGAVRQTETFSLNLPAGNEASAPEPEEIWIHQCEKKNVRLFLISSNRIRAKQAVYTYTAEDERHDPSKKQGEGHWDAHHINCTLQRSALELARLRGEAPALFHCHDGHAALLPVMMRVKRRYTSFFAGTDALITIHNAGWGYHQEIYDTVFAGQLSDLPQNVLTRGLLRGTVDPLLLGALYARVNTVSRGYAEEIMHLDWMTPGQTGDQTGGLGTAFRERGITLSGHSNGIDTDNFDPRYPARSGLDHAFDPRSSDLEGKELCRSGLLQKLHRCCGSLGRVSVHGSLALGDAWPKGPRPVLYTFIGRFADQKGIDLLLQVLPGLINSTDPLQFLILGTGSPQLEQELVRLSRKKSSAGKLVVLIGFDGLLAKEIYSAGDFFLVPSRFEPCGLSDLYAQLMGNLPVVHHVGGLKKVKDGLTGYSYREHSTCALAATIRRSWRDYGRC